MTDRKKYLADYQKNYIQIKVVIDKRDPDQMEMLEWLRQKGDVSNYLKSLVKEEMKKAEG